MPPIKNSYYRLLKLNWEEVAEEIGSLLAARIAEMHTRGLVIGISGGLDSAVVSFLGVKALGAHKVKGLFLPERDTEATSRHHARLIAEKGGFSLKEIDLTPPLEKLGCYRGTVAQLTRSKAITRLAFWSLQHLFQIDPYQVTLGETVSAALNQAIAFYRLKQRLRMAVLYQYAEQAALSVAGCLNRTELLTGFFVPHGDNAADLAPLLPLYKSQVRQLAIHLGVPKPIIDKSPSPDLFPGITDERALGIPYEELDLILYSLQQGLSPPDIAGHFNISLAKVKKIKKLVELSKKNRQITEPIF